MKEDLSRRAMLRAVDMAERITTRFAAQIPYGPTKVGMSPAELRRKIETMTPDQRDMFAQMVGGPEMALEFMNAIAAKKP